MKRIGLAVVSGVILMLLAPPAALAQDEPDPVVFGIYYRCNQGAEARADEIYTQTLGPIVQRHVDAGDLTGSLWFSHVQGGAWRRVFGLMGNDIDSMIDTRKAIVEEFQGEHPEASAELGSICSGHDDYIWTGVATSPPNPDTTGTATLSAYHACDMSREARADEIFEKLLAPLYKKQMEMGQIASWGYYAHRVGGRFRRLETMSGPDHKSLMATQAAVYGEAGEIDALALQEFRQICSWHVDYMWENSAQQ